jgi:hypothetical protein
MNHTSQLAKHFRDVYSGGNWTVSDMKRVLDGVTWQQATTKTGSFNTIAALVYHIHYFVAALTQVLSGEPINAHDKYSFDVPPITSESDWQKFLEKVFSEAEQCATLIARLPDEKLGEPFTDEKYGNYYRNILGTIEHTHYHLGQIALMKKMVAGDIKK